MGLCKHRGDDPSWLPPILAKPLDALTQDDIWDVFHYAWGRSKDGVYDKRLWNILDRALRSLLNGRRFAARPDVWRFQARRAVEAGLDEFGQCSYWPPDAPDEVYECRSECHHRKTCAALYAFQKARKEEDCGD